MSRLLVAMHNPLESPHDALAPKRPIRVKSTLCRRVREALESLGGEAHRSIVIEQVARNLGHNVHQIPEELQLQVIVSFEKTWANERKRAAYGFHLPFGKGSHRWGIVAAEGAVLPANSPAPSRSPDAAASRTPA